MNKFHCTELQKGDHAWAIMDNKLVMVMYDGNYGFDVCGPWEGGVSHKDIFLIEKVEKPQGYESTLLYYD